MEPHSKQSEESATASEPSVFFWARLKLTSIYIVILALILLGFSASLYRSFQRNLTDASEDDFAGTAYRHHFVENTLARVQNEILLIDLVVLIVAAGVGYFFAGYMLRPIRRSVEAQRIFSENASHELRTPLAVMKNEIEVLLRNPFPTPELIHSTLRSNIEEIDRMSRIAEDLLTLARSEHHAVPVAEKINVTEVARKIAEKMRSIAADKGISLGVTSDAELHVEGNKLGLERVLINLLQNAIEHTPQNGSLTVEILRQKSEAVITVSDTGSGIEEKDLPHIFERFYKGEGASGSGLGLSIVKELLDQQHGRIDIKSTKGTGTTVTIKLPLLL